MAVTSAAWMGVAIAGEENQLFHFGGEEAGLGAGEGDQLGEGFVGDVLPGVAQGAADQGGSLVVPLVRVVRPAGEDFHRADFFQGFVKGLSFVHLAGADEQADVSPSGRI